MKTRKPITTVSYNSSSFLRLKLEELRKAKIISVWFFIEHQPEEDEKKAHKHVFIIPAKTIQTDDLIDELIEPVPGSEKPLKCMHFQSCNSFPDWYLYSIHDASYLFRKGQFRKYSYTPDDMVCSDRDELDAMVHEIDMTDGTGIGRMANAIKQGISWEEYVRRGAVPVQLFKQYQAAWETLTGSFTYRNGRTTHSPIEVDPSTGVIIEDN